MGLVGRRAGQADVGGVPCPPVFGLHERGVDCAPRAKLNHMRYVWKAKGEEILAKIRRAWQAALGQDRNVTVFQRQHTSGGIFRVLEGKLKINDFLTSKHPKA